MTPEPRSLHEIEHLCLQIRAAIGKLPVSPDKKQFIDTAAVLVATSADASLFNLQHRPGGDKKAIRQLESFAKHLKTARDDLDGLSQEALQALYDELPGPEANLDIAVIPVNAILIGLREQALLAKRNLEAKPVKKAAGAPPDLRAAEVADRALGCYEALTGKEAHVTSDSYRDTNVRTGEFLDFLRDVFSALNISASPGYQAERAAKDRTMGGGLFMWHLRVLADPERTLKPKR